MPPAARASGPWTRTLWEGSQSHRLGLPSRGGRLPRSGYAFRVAELKTHPAPRHPEAVRDPDQHVVRDHLAPADDLRDLALRLLDPRRYPSCETPNRCNSRYTFAMSWTASAYRMSWRSHIAGSTQFVRSQRHHRPGAGTGFASSSCWMLISQDPNPDQARVAGVDAPVRAAYGRVLAAPATERRPAG
jgi:hypothetical protein